MTPEHKAKIDKLMPLALPILQGLLASGHYTQAGSYEDSEPEVIRNNAGEDYKEEGLKRQRYSVAVIDAVSLAIELIEEVDYRINRGLSL